MSWVIRPKPSANSNVQFFVYIVGFLGFLCYLGYHAFLPFILVYQDRNVVFLGPHYATDFLSSSLPLIVISAIIVFHLHHATTKTEKDKSTYSAWIIWGSILAFALLIGAGFWCGSVSNEAFRKFAQNRQYQPCAGLSYLDHYTTWSRFSSTHTETVEAWAKPDACGRKI